MTSSQHSAFSHLLESWRDYDNLRRSGATFIERIESQQRLDQARHDVWSSFR